MKSHSSRGTPCTTPMYRARKFFASQVNNSVVDGGCSMRIFFPMMVNGQSSQVYTRRIHHQSTEWRREKFQSDLPQASRQIGFCTSCNFRKIGDKLFARQEFR